MPYFTVCTPHRKGGLVQCNNSILLVSVVHFLCIQFSPMLPWVKAYRNIAQEITYRATYKDPSNHIFSQWRRGFLSSTYCTNSDKLPTLVDFSSLHNLSHPTNLSFLIVFLLSVWQLFSFIIQQRVKDWASLKNSKNGLLYWFFFHEI
jgi:hypothetical protein